MIYRVKVDVFLKDGVSDPEGFTIAEAAQSLEIAPIIRVRSGKSFLIELDISSEEEALAAAERLGRELLSNPVIEDFVVAELVEVDHG